MYSIISYYNSGIHFNYVGSHDEYFLPIPKFRDGLTRNAHTPMLMSAKIDYKTNNPITADIACVYDFNNILAILIWHEIDKLL